MMTLRLAPLVKHPCLTTLPIRAGYTPGEGPIAGQQRVHPLVKDPQAIMSLTICLALHLLSETLMAIISMILRSVRLVKCQEAYGAIHQVLFIFKREQEMDSFLGVHWVKSLWGNFCNSAP